MNLLFWSFCVYIYIYIYIHTFVYIRTKIYIYIYIDKGEFCLRSWQKEALFTVARLSRKLMMNGPFMSQT